MLIRHTPSRQDSPLKETFFVHTSKTKKGFIQHNTMALDDEFAPKTS
jgi:hypothetical protein